MKAIFQGLTQKLWQTFVTMFVRTVIITDAARKLSCGRTLHITQGFHKKFHKQKENQLR